jgi:hypothetical protein
LAPLWYRSPIVSIKVLSRPVGTKLTPRRRFSRLDMLLAFVGYSLILIALGIWLL